MNAISSASQYVLPRSHRVATSADAMDKAAKITYRSIDFYAVFTQNLSAPVKLLSSRLKVLSDMFEATRFFGTLSTLVTPNSKGVYFLKDPNHTWQKRVDRICLTFHTGLKMIYGGHRYELVDIGRALPLQRLYGPLTVFKFVTDGFIVLSSIFTIWDVALKIPKEKEKIKLASRKIEKWEYRPLQSALIRVGNQGEINELKASYVQKLAAGNKKCNEQQKELSDVQASFSDPTLKELSPYKRHLVIKEKAGKAKDLGVKIESWLKSKDKLERRLDRIENRDYRGLANEFDVQDADFRVRKWELLRNHHQSECTLGWLRVAAAVGKIAVITLALSMIALNVWTPFWLMSLLAVGITSDTSGLTKIFYEIFTLDDWKRQKKSLETEERERKLEELERKIIVTEQDKLKLEFDPLVTQPRSAFAGA